MPELDRDPRGRFFRNRMAAPPISPPPAQSAAGARIFLAVIIGMAIAAGWWFSG